MTGTMAASNLAKDETCIFSFSVTKCRLDNLIMPVPVWSAEITCEYKRPARLDMEKDSELVSSVVDILLTRVDLKVFVPDLRKKMTLRDDTLWEFK